MVTETEAHIIINLAARKLGVKMEPLPVDSSPAALDVEDSFQDPKTDINLKPTPKVNPDSEPE